MDLSKEVLQVPECQNCKFVVCQTLRMIPSSKYQSKAVVRCVVGWSEEFFPDLQLCSKLSCIDFQYLWKDLNLLKNTTPVHYTDIILKIGFAFWNELYFHSDYVMGVFNFFPKLYMNFILDRYADQYSSQHGATKICQQNQATLLGLP